MTSDFFDDDLLQSDGAARAAAGTRAAPRPGPDAEGLARHQKATSGQMAATVQEMEILRRRQDLLEKEKHELESLTRKQEEYESGKKTVIEALGSGIVGIEKDEVQATRMAELLGETRARFADALAELRAVNEDKWSDEEFARELDRALALVRNAQAMYRKAMARIEAAGWHRVSAPAGSAEEVVRFGSEGRKSFGYWLKVGLAVSLPGIVMALALFVAWLLASGVVF
ncbi:MAG: hypothetical protein FJ225_05240 [Lentisphaerae bacterium]|nr:hypothetical protein [Lentisphaerota bacterium]